MIAANTIYDALYAIPVANAGVLALLPGGTSSIFHRKQFGNLNGRVLPYLVWAYDVQDGGSGEMANVFADWFIYTASTAAERDLFTLYDALKAAYANTFAVTAGRVIIGRRGKPFQEATKDLQGLRVPVIYRALG